jgi:hypothetical protein
MTRKEAIHILINHAARDCAGAGCGPGHQVPSEEIRRQVAMAILKVWPEKHYGPGWFNLGLPNPEYNHPSEPKVKPEDRAKELAKVQPAVTAVE